MQIGTYWFCSVSARLPRVLRQLRSLTQINVKHNLLTAWAAVNWCGALKANLQKLLKLQSLMEINQWSDQFYLFNVHVIFSLFRSANVING